MAYNRHRRSLLDTEDWEAWDHFFVELFSTKAEKLSREEWVSLTWAFDAEFWGHVGARLFPD